MKHNAKHLPLQVCDLCHQLQLLPKLTDSVLTHTTMIHKLTAALQTKGMQELGRCKVADVTEVGAAIPVLL